MIFALKKPSKDEILDGNVMQLIAVGLESDKTNIVYKSSVLLGNLGTNVRGLKMVIIQRKKFKKIEIFH